MAPNKVTEIEQHAEVLSRAIDTLVVTRNGLAEFGHVEEVMLGETIDRLVRAVSVCIDIKQAQRKAGYIK